MKRCPECGREYADKYRFCQTDRAMLTAVEEAPAAAPPPPRDETLRCAACGAGTRAQWKFCSKCRAPLSQPAEAQRLPPRPHLAATPPPPAPTEIPASTPPASASSEAAPRDNGNGEDHAVIAPLTEELRGETMSPASTTFVETAQPPVVDAPAEPLDKEKEADIHATEVGSGEVDSNEVNGDEAASMDAAVHLEAAPHVEVREREADGGLVSELEPEANSHMLRVAVAVSAVVVLIAVVFAIIMLRRQPETARKNVSPKVSPTPAAASTAATKTPAAAVATAPEGMVRIPGGTFMMGSDGEDLYESPAHEVAVAPFYIGKYEVTCDEYQKFVDEMSYPAPPGWVNGRFPSGAAHLPVTGVSWTDASAFAQWAHKRLPTEEEWEFAARGFEGRLYPWGSEWKANAANAAGDSAGKMVEVGSYPEGRSPFEVFDMIGNAWEWTASNMTAYPGGQLPKPTATDMKVIRGNFWGAKANQATATFRRGYPARGMDYANTGFRCALDIGAGSAGR